MQHYAIYLIIGLIALFVIAGWVRSISDGRRQARQRRATLRAMGFVELPPEQVFANPRAVAATFPQDQMCTISATAGKGQSALGETVLFDVSWNIDQVVAAATVAGFRVDPALPDFRVLYVWNQKLNHAFGNAWRSVTKAVLPGGSSAPAAATDANTAGDPAVALTRRRALNAGSVARFLKNAEERNALLSHLLKCDVEIADPAFSLHHQVSGSNEAGVRAVLTEAFIKALTSEAFGNMGVHKSGEWLFVYAASGVLMVSSPDYPHWLDHTVALAQKLNLHPADLARNTTADAPDSTTTTA